MEYRIVKAYQEDKQLRKSFDQLSKEIFDLSFEEWYLNGFWGDKYIPYSILIDNEIIANVSVNIMDFTIKNEKKCYLQLGTIMTKPAYRGKGYIRILIDQIKIDYANFGGMFLWANDSVLSLYPKFGFKKYKEYRFQTNIYGEKRDNLEHIEMKTPDDWNRFLYEKSKRKSNGIIQLDNDGLLMFYLSQFMKENVYYLKELDAYIVAEIENNTLVLYDIYSYESVDLNEVSNSFGTQIDHVRFAFTPCYSENLTPYEYTEKNSTFFILGKSLENDMEYIKSFSDLYHA